MEHQMSIIETLRHKYALTRQGAKDLVKSSLASAAMDIVLMLPVGLMFFLVKDLMEGNALNTWGYIWKIGACLLAVAAMEYLKYNYQFVTVYLESGRRRISLAEKLRRLPLSFFGKKDLADLTSTIMADAATIETGTSHWVPELIGSMISTTLIGISLFFFDWRMALAAVWVIPIAISIVLFSSKFQNPSQAVSFSEFVAWVDSGQVASVDISGNEISAPYPAPYATNDRGFRIYLDAHTDGFSIENNSTGDNNPNAAGGRPLRNPRPIRRDEIGDNHPGPNIIFKQ